MSPFYPGNELGRPAGGRLLCQIGSKRRLIFNAKIKNPFQNPNAGLPRSEDPSAAGGFEIGSKKSRSGYSLVECIVAMGLIGAVFSSIALSLHATHQMNRHVRDEVASDLEWSRFSAQFRGDAHLANSAKTENPGGTGASASVLTFAMPDGRMVAYTIEPRRIERVVRRDQAVVHRESYPLPAASVARWQIDTGRREPVASLVVEPSPLGANQTPQPGALRVDAAVRLLQTKLPAPKPNAPKPKS